MYSTIQYGKHASMKNDFLVHDDTENINNKYKYQW